MHWKALSASLQCDFIKEYLVRVLNKAIRARNQAIENNENMKNLLVNFVGKPENYQLNIETIEYYLGYNIPDIKPILRTSDDKIYKPATAAMSLVLRAGIGENAESTFELIRESVAKTNISI